MCLTHYANKQIPEHKRANPDPEENVDTCEGHTGYFDEVIVYLVPLIQSEELEKSDHGVEQRATWRQG